MLERSRSRQADPPPHGVGDRRSDWYRIVPATDQDAA